MDGIKKTVFAMAVFSSAAAVAGTMGPVCNPDQVTTPCEQRAWAFGAEALYLKPSYSGDAYLTSFTNEFGVTRWNHFNPDWGWGFKLEGAYHFNTGNDITLNWYHYSKTTDQTVFVTANDALFELNSEFKPRWDAVNAEFGQYTDFGALKNIRFHGGVQYARISHHYYLDVPSQTQDETLRNVFNGFGPRIGMDLGYDWNNGFGVYANGAGALLVGDSTFDTSTLGFIANTGRSSASNTIVVPELEAKLGLTYTRQFTEADLTLNAGWMWLNYFNVVDALSAQGTGIHTSFALQGPFIGLNYLGYV